MKLISFFLFFFVAVMAMGQSVSTKVNVEASRAVNATTQHNLQLMEQNRQLMEQNKRMREQNRLLVEHNKRMQAMFGSLGLSSAHRCDTAILRQVGEVYPVDSFNLAAPVYYERANYMLHDVYSQVSYLENFLINREQVDSVSCAWMTQKGGVLPERGSMLTSCGRRADADSVVMWRSPVFDSWLRGVGMLSHLALHQSSSALHTVTKDSVVAYWVCFSDTDSVIFNRDNLYRPGCLPLSDAVNVVVIRPMSDGYEQMLVLRAYRRFSDEESRRRFYANLSACVLHLFLPVHS